MACTLKIFKEKSANPCYTSFINNLGPEKDFMKVKTSFLFYLKNVLVIKLLFSLNSSAIWLAKKNYFPIFLSLNNTQMLMIIIGNWKMFYYWLSEGNVSFDLDSLTYFNSEIPYAILLLGQFLQIIILKDKQISPLVIVLWILQYLINPLCSKFPMKCYIYSMCVCVYIYN